jgi:hypothetical protein
LQKQKSTDPGTSACRALRTSRPKTSNSFVRSKIVLPKTAGLARPLEPAANGKVRALLNIRCLRCKLLCGRCNTRAGDKVRFQVSDIFLPSPGGVLPSTPEETELEGTIVDFSDSGLRSRFFAVIEVVRIQSLIVPVDKLEVIKAATIKGET